MIVGLWLFDVGLHAGTKLFKAVMEKCDETNEESKKGSVNAIEEAYLHVQTNNDDAIKFYQARALDPALDLICCLNLRVTLFLASS